MYLFPLELCYTTSYIEAFIPQSFLSYKLFHDDDDDDDDDNDDDDDDDERL